MYQRIVLYFLETILKGLLLIINGHLNDDKIVKAYNKYAESTLKFIDDGDNKNGKNHKSYHFQLGRVFYGVKSTIYNIADSCGVSVVNFNQSGILLVDYYITICGNDENIKVFEQNLRNSFERLRDDDR